MDVDDGSVKSYKPVQKSLVLNAYASSESLKRGDVRAKRLGTVHESLAQVIYANSEGPGERAHSCIIGYLKQQGDNSSRRQLRDW